MTWQRYGMCSVWAFLPLAAAVGGFGGDERPGRDRRRTPIVEAYERAHDSVVNISATEKVEVQRLGLNVFGNLFAVPTERQQRSVGSGFIIDKDGYIVTNGHVVAAGAELTVKLVDGTEYEAWIIGQDTARDLAVIKINPDRPLTPIPLGRSDDLMIGENTIAIGNPVGLNNTVTTGVISALRHDVEVGGRVVYHELIQTDASINPGNSGGPLLNVLGELIGINTAIRTDAQNIGFAIPVDQLREVLPDILDSEKLNKIQVGMRVSGVEPVRVTDVRKGSPADFAGVKPGDIVRAIDGRRLDRGVDFYVAMLDRRPGESVKLDLLRGGAPTETRLTLTPAPEPDGNPLAERHLGVTIVDAKESTSRRLQAGSRRRATGVIVLAVEPKGPAALAGIRPGDLLLSLGPHWLTGVDHVGALLAGVEAGDPVDVGFRRASRGRLYHGEVRLHAR